MDFIGKLVVVPWQQPNTADNCWVGGFASDILWTSWAEAKKLAIRDPKPSKAICCLKEKLVDKVWWKKHIWVMNLFQIFPLGCKQKT